VWEFLAKQEKLRHPGVKIVKVDCTKHESLCSSAKVQGFPTLVWYAAGQRVTTYNGDRSLAALTAFVNENAGPEDVTPVTEVQDDFFCR
jgi:thioredoxin-like negative regulator of GroEL